MLAETWMRFSFCFAILLATAVASSGSAEAAKWTERRLPPQPIEGSASTNKVLLYAVSCPSDSLCVAVGALDTVAFSRTPTGAADRWHVVNPLYDEPKQKCVEEGLLMASCYRPRGSIDAISCPDESLCVAVGYEGSVFTSTDPTGGAAAWSVSDLNEGPGARHLTGVSCPSASLCVAVSGGYGAAAGTILTSTAPASERWQAAQLPGAPDLRSVSCATPTSCVAVAKKGRIFASSDPTGGAPAWRELGSPTPRDLHAVACVASLLCVAGDAGGNLLTSADPGGGAPFSATNAAGSVLITGLSCPTTTRCVAVDNNSDVLTSTDPTGGPGSWTFENLVPFEASYPDTGQFVGNALFGASCASTSLCVLVGAESRIFTSTDPFVAASSRSAGPARKRVRLRPRTHVVFAERFWRRSLARDGRVKARFRFYSATKVRGFECKRDRGRYRPCRSPLRYWVKPGRHVLRVRAIGPTGLRGPARIKRFHVLAPRHLPR